jgi:single-stranded-DNA-specific exonuclease
MSVTEVQGSVWRVKERNQEAEERLCTELGVSSLVSAVLVGRGLSVPEDAQAFLNPTLDDLHDPSLLPDFRPAVDAILAAREAGEKIYVHGDYDVDGVTSAALFTRFLGKIGCDVTPHVPHRMREGYGIHASAVESAKNLGAKLFLTCDCGVSAFEQVAAARDAGMKVVVTDHHEVGSEVPTAEAVVNPHRPESQYPFDQLSGVGVVFKLCAGITEELGHKKESFYRAYLDLAVLGTVADVMPLVGENRVITRYGLAQLAGTRKAGLLALMDVSGAREKRLTARTIGFQLGPRINAVGRIDDAGLALDLLLTEDRVEARKLADILDQHNTDRRAEQNRMLEEALEEAEMQVRAGSPVIVLAREGWHPGIIGIVAGKLVDRFRRPSFVVTIGDDGQARGSARSIEGFNLAEAIESARDHLTSGGGHEMAAGFSLGRDGIGALTETLGRHAGALLKPEDFLPRYHIDAVVSGEEAGPQAFAQFALLEPFGQANPEPLFATYSARMLDVVPTSNPDHVRVTVEAADGSVRKGMAFGIGRALAALDQRDRVDLAFSMEENEWNGSRQFRWIVRDYRLSTSA